MVLGVYCDFRASDQHRIFSCNVMEVFNSQSPDRPEILIQLPASKNDPEGVAESTNTVVCSCDSEAFTNAVFDMDCSYHILHYYRERIPEPESQKILFLRSLTANRRGFKRGNYGINTIKGCECF